MPKNIGLMASAGRLQHAFVDDRVERTIFAYFFCEGIRNGCEGIPSASNDRISLTTLSEYINWKTGLAYGEFSQESTTISIGPRDELWISKRRAQLSPESAPSDTKSAEKRRLRVFLCHAHSDSIKVRNLYKRLSRSNIDAWLDKEKILPGQDWQMEIHKAVQQSDVVVVCLSKRFNQAGFRQREVRLALEIAMEQPQGEIFLIPARLEECDNLENLKQLNWVDLFKPDGYERLMRALKVRAQKVGAAL